MEKGELKYKFRIAIERGFLSPVKDQELENATEAEKRLLLSKSDFGSYVGACNVELEDDEGHVNRYYAYDNGYSLIGGFLGIETAAITAGILLGNPLIPIAALPVAMNGLGSVDTAQSKITSYHDSLEMPIDLDTYLKTLIWLDRKVGKTTLFGTFNNCAHLAIAAARKVGIKDLGHAGFSCPDALAKRIRILAQRDDIDQKPYKITLLEDSFPRKQPRVAKPA